VAAHQQLESLLQNLPACFPGTAEVLMRELTEKRRILLKCAAVLSHVPAIAAIVQRLRLSRHDAARLEGLIRHHARALGFLASPCPSPREVTRFFRAAHAVLPDLLLNAAADLMAEPAAPTGRSQGFRSFTAELLHTYFFAYMPRWQSPPPISGNDLIREFGLKPSALFKQILDSIEEERLSGSEVRREAALEMVRAYLKNLGGNRSGV
jgi:hypothetical protein